MTAPTDRSAPDSGPGSVPTRTVPTQSVPTQSVPRQDGPTRTGPTGGGPDRSGVDRVRLGTTLGVPLVLGVAFAATVGPESLLEAASRPAALGKMLAGLVGWLVLSWFVLPRLIRPTGPRMAAVGVLAVAAAAGMIGPYYLGTTVEDATPVVPAGAPGAPGVPAGPATAGAVVVARGEVAGIGHSGSGAAQLIRLGDGSFVVRFENLSVDNAPDAHVYLVPGAGQESPGGVRLDALKGNRGDQNYRVDAGDVAPGPVTALIWCRAFSVPIGAATLL